VEVVVVVDIILGFFFLGNLIAVILYPLSS
jgi:hypothetical protein